jgi:hypothetical protein
MRDTLATVMDPHGMPSGGDWALQKTAAVMLEGPERVTLRGITFERLDGHAVSILAYNRNATVAQSEGVWLGSSFVVSWGNCSGSPIEGFGWDCTEQNMPVGNVLDSNFVHEIGIWEKQVRAPSRGERKRAGRWAVDERGCPCAACAGECLL